MTKQRQESKRWAFLLIVGLLFGSLPAALPVARGDEVAVRDAASRQAAANFQKFIDNLPATQKNVRLDDEVFRADDLRRMVRAHRASGSSMHTRLAFQPSVQTWPGGIVYYTFASDVSSANRSNFVSAVHAWELAAHISFVARTTQSNYVYVQNSTDGNYSFVGMLGGSQALHVQDWDYPSIIMHEAGHALGLIHEHQRSDRDNYLDIFLSNVTSGQESNFLIIDNSLNKGPYDFESIMHYDPYAFSRDGTSYTMYPKAAYTQYAATMGLYQDKVLSQIDKDGIAQVYGAPTTVSAPPNDLLENAITLSGARGQVTSTTVGATKSSGEPNHAQNPGGASVWYRWTATRSGLLTLSTSGSGFDTLLAAYSGSGISNLALVAQNDDVSTSVRTSLLSFQAVAGTTYLFAVDGFRNTDTNALSTGTFTLSWSLPAPANDLFANAQLLSNTPNSGQTTGTNDSATRETNEPHHGGNVGGASVWYRWSAPADGSLLVSTQNSSFDTLLGVYTGTSVDNLVSVAQDDDSGPNHTSVASFNVQHGATYFIAVDGYSDSSGVAAGNIQLNWTFSLVADTTAPVVSVSNPAANGASFAALPQASGTASDNIGVASVSILLRRYATGTLPEAFWNGSAWTSTQTYLNATLSGGNWSFALPSAAQMKEGHFAIQAFARDMAGNSGSSGWRDFFFDGIKPVVRVGTPLNNGAYPNITSATGAFADGSALRGLTVMLYRYVTTSNPAAFWNGSGWTSSYNASVHEQPATLNGKTWSFAMPPTAQMNQGRYYLHATATDSFGNVGVSPASIFFIDRTTPTISISAPINNRSYSSLATASGTTSDNMGGAGVKGVTVMLYRYASGSVAAAYWNGTTWQSSGGSSVLRPALLSGTSWSYTLPAQAQGFTTGRYLLRADATDRAGNRRSATSIFNITMLGGVVAHAGVPSVLSTASIQTSDAQITLSFTMALDAVSVDVARFSVQVEGVDAVVERVEVVSNRVTLHLKPGILSVGDEVAVGWSGLRDASQIELDGYTRLTAR